MHFRLAYTTTTTSRVLVAAAGWLYFTFPPLGCGRVCGFVWIQFSGGGVGEGTIGKLFVLRFAMSPEIKRQKSIFFAKNPPRTKPGEENWIWQKRVAAPGDNLLDNRVKFPGAYFLQSFPFFSREMVGCLPFFGGGGGGGGPSEVFPIGKAGGGGGIL